MSVETVNNQSFFYLTVALTHHLPLVKRKPHSAVFTITAYLPYPLKEELTLSSEPTKGFYGNNHIHT